jgi:hypothetical protein
MVNRKTILAGLIAAILLPSYAAAEVYISIDPPARRIEHFDARPGYVVVPGVWEFRNGKHEWVAGHYVAERKGYRYQGDRWVRHDNDQWTMQRGGWSRDSDGDGTPDRLDSHPYDPRRK